MITRIYRDLIYDCATRCPQSNSSTWLLDLIASGEPRETRTAFRSLSTCGLFVRGLLRASGARDPLIDPPYKIGTVISAIVKLARKRDWIIDPEVSLTLGDIVLLTGPEHMLVVLSVTSDYVLSVEGGIGMHLRKHHISKIAARIMAARPTDKEE